MDKTLIAHVAGEAIVLIGVVVYFSRQNKALVHHVTELTGVVSKYEDKIKELDERLSKLEAVNSHYSSGLEKVYKKVGEQDGYITALINDYSQRRAELQALTSPVPSGVPSSTLPVPQGVPPQRLPQVLPMVAPQHDVGGLVFTAEKKVFSSSGGPRHMSLAVPSSQQPPQQPSSRLSRQGDLVRGERKVSFSLEEEVSLPSKSGGLVSNLQVTGKPQETTRLETTRIEDISEEEEDLDAELSEEYKKMEENRQRHPLPPTGGSLPPTGGDDLQFIDLNTKDKKK